MFLVKKVAIEVKFNSKKTGNNIHKKSFLGGYPDLDYQAVSFENCIGFLGWKEKRYTGGQESFLFLDFLIT